MKIRKVHFTTLRHIFLFMYNKNNLPKNIITYLTNQLPKYTDASRRIYNTILYYAGTDSR